MEPDPNYGLDTVRSFIFLFPIPLFQIMEIWTYPKSTYTLDLQVQALKRCQPNCYNLSSGVLWNYICIYYGD